MSRPGNAVAALTGALGAGAIAAAIAGCAPPAPEPVGPKTTTVQGDAAAISNTEIRRIEVDGRTITCIVFDGYGYDTFSVSCNWPGEPR